MTAASGEGEMPREASRRVPSGVGAAPDQAAVAELLALVEDLDADNERLRLRVLELLELMEQAVTEQVAGERRIAELDGQRRALEAELDAVRKTRVMRMTAPARRAYARLRSRNDPGASG